MPIFNKISRILERFLDYVTLVIFCTMVAAIVIQVFARFVLNSPTVWSEELARFLMVALTMFGSAAVIGREGHIAVTVLMDRLPNPLMHAVLLLRDVLLIGMAGILTHAGFGLAVIAKRQVSTGMEIPMYVPYAAIPIGSVFIAVMLLLNRLSAKSDKAGGEGAS